MARYTLADLDAMVAESERQASEAAAAAEAARAQYGDGDGYVAALDHIAHKAAWEHDRNQQRHAYQQRSDDGKARRDAERAAWQRGHDAERSAWEEKRAAERSAWEDRRHAERVAHDEAKHRREYERNPGYVPCDGTGYFDEWGNWVSTR